MYATLTQIGNKIESAPNLQTLSELLSALEGCAYYGMLRTVAGHICSCLKVPPEQLAIDALVDVVPSLKQYLKERPYKRNAIRSYCNYARILLREAKQLGCAAAPPELPGPWTEVLAAMTKRPGCNRAIIRYAIRLGKAPAAFTDSDLNAWGQTLLEGGRRYSYVNWLKSCFRRALSESGLAEKLPGIAGSSEKHPPYGIPLHSFPAELRAEVEALLQWKQAPFVADRPRWARHRPITAARLQACISRLYGFVTTIEKRTDVTTLVDLVTQKSVVAFTEWSINHRELKGATVAGDLRLLYAAMRWYPAYKQRDFRWLGSVISQIQPDSEDEKRERKARKYLPYEVLADVPARMLGRRKEIEKLGSRALAELVHNALLLLWLLILAWRQRNIRECRLEHHLFKAEIPPLVSMKIPRWAREKIAANPHEQFWQFRFREDQTKTGHEIRSILPHRLVPLLEEYLERHRPVLLGGRPNPGTLFLNRHGGPLRREQITSLVSNLTLRYAHRRVTPHLFRDSYAYWWLAQNPEDYLTLSKVLWHKDIKTTLTIYSCNFDESHALCRVEDWLDQREEESGSQPAGAAKTSGGTTSAGVPKAPFGKAPKAA